MRRESGGAGKQRRDRPQTDTQTGEPGVKMVRGSPGVKMVRRPVGCAGSWVEQKWRSGRPQVEGSVQFSSDAQSCPTIFDPLTAVRQTSLYITNSQSLLRLTSIELMMPSNHLILCCPLLFLPSIFPSIRVFSNESLLCIRWLSIEASASASVLPMNIQD